MSSGRYAEALGPTIAWLQLEHRGWGAVIAPASEQREIALELTKKFPARAVIELGAEATPDWFDAVGATGAASADAAGAFVYFARGLEDKARERVLAMLNQQRDLTSDHGVWTLVVSARELTALRRHAPDLASVLRSIETVPFIPRTLTDEELASARAELHAYYQRRFGRLDLRGFIRSEQEDVSFPVEAIYQPLEATRPRTMKEVFEDPHEPLYADRRAPLIDFLRDTSRLVSVIVGAPGSGKSFFLRWCALEASRSTEFIGVESAVPLYLPLALIRAAPIVSDLESYVVDAFLDADLTIAHAIRHQARAGKVVFLLDGVDEVGPDIQRVAREVRQLAIRYPRARVVITSRPTALEAVELPGDPFTVAGLDRHAITALLRGWCELYEVQRVGRDGAAMGRAEGTRLAEEVLASPQLRELASSPLLATIIAIVHRAGVRLPDHRVELYEHIVRILVERWNQLRTRDVEADVPAIRTSDAIRLLGPVAYELVRSGREGAVGEDALRALITPRLSRGNVRAFSDADAAIRIFRESLGVIVEQAPGIYSFLHKTLGEFLAAHEAARTGALEALVESGQCFSPAWREVTLLALGIVGTLRADDERTAALVERLVGALHARRGDDGARGAALLGSLLVDDPGLAASTVGQMLDELIPFWWLDRGEIPSHRLVETPWAHTIGRRLAVGYARGIGTSYRQRSAYECHLLELTLEVFGLPWPPYRMELLVALAARPRTESHRSSLIVAADVLRDPAGDLRIELRESFTRALARGPAIDLLRIVCSGIDGEESLMPVSDGSELVAHPRGTHPIESAWLQLSLDAGRSDLLPSLLVAWRELAADYPEGPRPPATVEEAIAKYGPPADRDGAGGGAS